MKYDHGDGNLLIWDGKKKKKNRIGPMALFAFFAEFLDQLSSVMYTSSKANHTLTGHVISSEKSGKSSLQCMKYCTSMADGKCKSFNHNKVTSECQLNNETGRDEIDDMKLTEGYNHYYITKSNTIMLP